MLPIALIIEEQEVTKALSQGVLACGCLQVGGIVMKHQPPPEAAKPDKKWRLYVFKGDKLVEDDPYYLHR